MISLEYFSKWNTTSIDFNTFFVCIFQSFFTFCKISDRKWIVPRIVMRSLFSFCNQNKSLLNIKMQKNLISKENFKNNKIFIHASKYIDFHIFLGETLYGKKIRISIYMINKVTSLPLKIKIDVIWVLNRKKKLILISIFSKEVNKKKIAYSSMERNMYGRINKQKRFLFDEKRKETLLYIPWFCHQFFIIYVRLSLKHVYGK